MVNIWPRPGQQPHPPIWVPGNASPSTWDFVVERDYCYCYLTDFGAKGAGATVNGYWDKVAEMGRDRNPYRLGYLIPVGVSETDEQAEADYGKAIEYFYHKLLHIPEQLLIPPGHMTHSSLEYLLTKRPLPPFEQLKENRFRDFDRDEYLVTGSAATVTDRLLDIVKRLNVGNLMVLLHFGNMSQEKCIENIDRFAAGVLPTLQKVWDDEGWENRWWPQAAERPNDQEAAA